MDRRLRKLYRSALEDPDTVSKFLAAVRRSAYNVDQNALQQYFRWRAEEQGSHQLFAQTLEMCSLPLDERLVAIVKLFDFLDQVGIPAQCSNYPTYPRPHEEGIPQTSVDFFVFLRTHILWDVVIPGWEFDDPATSYYPTSGEFLGWSRIQIIDSDQYRLSASNQRLERDLDEEDYDLLHDDSHPLFDEQMRTQMIESYLGRDMNSEVLFAYLSEHRPMDMVEYIEYFAPQLEGVLDVDFDVVDTVPQTLDASFPARFPLNPVPMGENFKELMAQREALLPPLDDYEFILSIRRNADTDRVSIRPADPAWQQIIPSEGSFLVFRDIIAATQVEWMQEQFGHGLTWNDIFKAFMRSIAQEFEQNVLFCGHLSVEAVECPECGDEHVCPACFESEECHA